MNAQRVAILCSGLFALLLSMTAGAATAPLEAYGRLPKYDDVQLSPNGGQLALVLTEGTRRAIAVLSLPDGKPINGAVVGEEKPRGIQWADEDHLLVIRSVTSRYPGLFLNRNEFVNLLAFDVGTGKTTSLPVRGRGDNLVDTILSEPMIRRIDGHTVLFFRCLSIRLDKSKAAAAVLVRYDLQSGTQRVIRSSGTTSEDWFVDDGGHVNAVVNYDQKSQKWTLSRIVDEEARVVQTGSSGIEVPSVVGFGADGGTVLVSMLEGNTETYHSLTVSSGTLSEKSVVPGDLGPLFDAYTSRWVGTAGVGDWSVYHFDDPVRQGAWESVVKLFPGARVQLRSASSDFKKLVIRVDGRDQGLSYRLVDLEAGRVTPIGDVYPGIKTLNEVRTLNYKAADGLAIRAYLTLPDGHAPTKLPLVALVHGGPASRDTADFDWWGQALASQGYAVLQANYRGSALGYQFMSAGFGEWGRKMQTDVSDGVKYLVDQGIVDPKRVCIVGGSYGGYAALAGVSLQSNIYRCAVSVAGLGDLQTLLRYTSNYKSDVSLRYWDRFMGVSGPNDDLAAKLSPQNHIDAISVPVMLVHGKDDTVVPYQQSEAMAAAMKHAGKNVEFVTLNGEDHWLSRPETRLQMLQASVEFLRKYNPPD